MKIDSVAVCIGLSIFIYAWLEYIVHRFDMHKRGSLRFQSHTVEHHGQMHMGENQASLTQSDVAIVFWFSFPLALLLGPTFTLCWAGMLFWAGFTWTAVHRHIHGEPGYWYAYILCPWLPLVRWNHLKHHANPKRNFGGMFWFLTDTVAFTL